MSLASSLLDKFKKIMDVLPKDAEVTRIDMEGPSIVVYVKNPTFILEHSEIVKSLAKEIKKRIVIKTDKSVRKNKEEAKKLIMEIVPKEAHIVEIEFDDEMGEVIIKAKNPILVYGKDASIFRKILVSTGWRPRPVRAPLMKSKIVESILAHMITESDYRLKLLRRVGEQIHRDVIFKDNYVRITALGGFMEVGRSAILVETAESKILLDFGLNPGAQKTTSMFPRIDLLGINPEEIDAVVIAHAHLDHCGLVPYLFKYGFDGPVYVTEPTRDLMALLQIDLLRILKGEGRPKPFALREVNKMLLHTITLKYGEVTDIAPDVRLTFYNAGHILGSAMVHLHVGNGLHNILYTSDFKYGRTKLLEKAHTQFPRVDTLIIECTYGSTPQPSRIEAERQLITVIKKTIERGGKVLIPTLSVGRAQEIMLVLAEAMENNIIPKIPVYIEGMIDEVTAIHTAYPEYLSKEVRAHFLADRNPFAYETFVIVEDIYARSDIVESEKPVIIMATSGMLTGGPAVEYFKLMAPDPRNSLIFVSYQVEGTLGRRIKDGEREIQFMTPEGKVEIIRVNMEVYSIEGFSGHSDQRQLYNFIRDLQPKPKRIILNHGEPSAIRSFMNLVRVRRERLGLAPDVDVIAPRVLDSLMLT